MGKPKRNQLDSYAPDVLEHFRRGDNFTEQEKRFRQAFIAEYVKDFSANKAYQRCGRDVEKVTAYTRGAKLLQEPYTLLLLEQLLREKRATDIVSRNQVLERLWFEANNEKNSGKERISALAHLAKCLGMMRDVVVETPEAPQTVMLVPVMAASEWEAAASAAQLSLKARATSAPISNCPPPPPPFQASQN